ncbi:MAG: MFS transporter, partial [Syntrophales bacterium]
DQNRFFYGYVVVAVCFAIQVVGWGIHNSFGIFFAPLTNEFGWSRASIAGAGAVSVLIHGIGSIITGGMNDRIGPRKIMTGCGLLMGTGYMLMSRVDTLWEIYLFYGLIIGIGVSGTDVVLLSTAARWFHTRRGIVTGIIKVGTGLGMVVMPLFITLLLNQFPWRTAFFILGALILTVYVLLAQLLVRDPALKNQYPDNAKRPDDGARREEGLTFREILRTRRFWTLCVATLLVVSCTYTVMMHIVPHLIDIGISPARAASVLSLVGGISIVGRFVLGAIVDKTGAKKALMIPISLLFTALCVLVFAKTMGMFYLFAVIQGFAHGGFYALISPTVAEFFGTREHGIILGAVIFSTTIGGSVGPFAAGYVFDVTGTYSVVFAGLAGISLVALALTATFKSAHGKIVP